MNTHKTYREAIKAAGTTRGIFKHKETGEFAHIENHDSGPSLFWESCKPEDYLKPVCDLREVKKGDWVVHITGAVTRIENPNMYNNYDGEFSHIFFVDTDDTVADQFNPQIGDEVKTHIGIGEIKTTVLAGGETTYVVQFENDWNTFTFDELSPVDEDYENGKAIYELFSSCFTDDYTVSDFDKVDSGVKEAWIDFAKLVKPVDVG